MASRPLLPFPTSSQLQLIEKCPASYWREKPLTSVKGGGNGAADLGTRLHKCIEACFSHGWGGDPMMPEIQGRFKPHSGMLKAEELDCAFEFEAIIGFVIGFLTRPEIGFMHYPDRDELYRHSADVLWETKLFIKFGRTGMCGSSMGHPDPYVVRYGVQLAGTADLVVVPHYGRGDVNIIDWKTGAHEVDHPMNNLQLISLAYMSIVNPDACKDIKDDKNGFKLWIVNPTTEQIQFHRYTAAEIVSIYEERIKPLLMPTHHERTGAHCFYCPRKGVCHEFYTNTTVKYLHRAVASKGGSGRGA